MICWCRLRERTKFTEIAEWKSLGNQTNQILSCSGKLQWERDIPQDSLDNLQNLANTDFHANLGKIIHDIYLTAHNLFMDMPQGNLVYL